MRHIAFFPIVFLALLLLNLPAMSAEKTLVATGGGSQKLIANTLPTITMAIMNGIDSIELDVGATSDGKLILCKDPALNGRTDVATVFPDRHQADGGYYSSDFTLAEIRQLRLNDLFETGPTSLSLGIPTLAEALALIKKMEILAGTTVHIALEITGIHRYREQGIDIARTVLACLKDFGYTGQESGLWLQSYDSGELQRLKNELMPEFQMNLPLVQMIDDNTGNKVMVREGTTWKPYNYDWMFTFSGLHVLAAYAQAIALPEDMVIDAFGSRLLTGYLQQVRSYGILIYLHSLPSADRTTGGDAAASAYDEYLSLEEIDGFYCDDYSSCKQKLTKQTNPGGQQDLPPFFSTLNLSRPQPQANPEAATEEPAEPALRPLPEND